MSFHPNQITGRIEGKWRQAGIFISACIVNFEHKRNMSYILLTTLPLVDTPRYQAFGNEIRHANRNYHRKHNAKVQLCSSGDGVAAALSRRHKRNDAHDSSNLSLYPAVPERNVYPLADVTSVGGILGPWPIPSPGENERGESAVGRVTAFQFHS